MLVLTPKGTKLNSKTRKSEAVPASKYPPPLPFNEAYPELEKEAQRIADLAVMEINAAAGKVVSTMPYKNQAILERLIQLLEAKV